MKPASNMKDMTGRIFGRLTVITRAPHELRFGKLAAWRCQCVCGIEVAIVGKTLRNGLSKSCGCLKRDTLRQLHSKHREALKGRQTREYRAWCEAKTRCYNAKLPSYKNYGGRGITMADEWLRDYPAFLRDMGRCPEGYSLDRIDNAGHYDPGNCRWATKHQQANNCRTNRAVTWNGETCSLSEWARRTGINYRTLQDRLVNGWTPERALTAPVHHRT